MALQGLGEGVGKEDLLQRARKEVFGVMKVFSMSILVVVTGLYTFIRTLLNIHLKLLDFIVCILYFNKAVKNRNCKNDMKNPV